MNTITMLSDSALTDRLYSLRKQERHLLVEFLHHLGELDERKLYCPLGLPSLFAFCTDHLGYTSSATYRRTTCCRLLRRFPILAGYLGDGPRTEPPSESRHLLRVAVGGSFVAGLYKVRDALSHIAPDRNIEEVLHEWVLRTLKDHTRRSHRMPSSFFKAILK